jgi:hypothetical protein
VPLGRFVFAGAVFLGLAYFALRSPLPAVDPRFLQQDFAGAGPALSMSVYLDTGYLRERAHTVMTETAAHMRKIAGGGEPGAPELAQAEALEDAVARLQAAGIRNAMIRFGGQLVVRGQRGGAPWRIGLRNPRGTGPQDALAYLLADRDEAIATHGDERVVTVLGPDAPTAAELAQGLFAAGARWRDQARADSIAQVMVVERDGTVTVTAALAKRLKFLHGIAPRVVP